MDSYTITQMPAGNYKVTSESGVCGYFDTFSQVGEWIEKQNMNRAAVLRKEKMQEHYVAMVAALDGVYNTFIKQPERDYDSAVSQAHLAYNNEINQIVRRIRLRSNRVPEEDKAREVRDAALEDAQNTYFAAKTDLNDRVSGIINALWKQYDAEIGKA